jgi:hypothetical protein
MSDRLMQKFSSGGVDVAVTMPSTTARVMCVEVVVFDGKDTAAGMNPKNPESQTVVRYQNPDICSAMFNPARRDWPF